MPQPGALVPSRGEPVTLGAVADTPAGVGGGFRIVVATAGSLFVRYKESEEICELNYPTGVFWEPGHFKQIWTDGVIVLNPANTIIGLNP